MMDVLSIILSVAAIIISILGVVWTRNQAKRAKEALDQQKRFYQVQTVLHFTQTFFGIGRPTLDELQKSEWKEKYWSLLSAEFYFYHQGAIPKLMYMLWMVDLADLYADHPIAWVFHEKSLDFYAVLYPEMKDFFSHIYEFSKIDSRDTRHREVKKFVLKWIKDNPGRDIE